ncbi:MAG TPA: histidine kinase [Verrucomicrobiae bacterium]|nr:histidine kinase [Verrucomicrobiae bacterium]
MTRIRGSKAWRSLAVAIFLAAFNAVFGEQSRTALTSAAAVLSLSPKKAGKHLPVFVRGVVTAAEPNWKGQFFVQDSTGGIFVENISQHQPAPGDLVEITGMSYTGAFAPIIGHPKWKKLGAAPLPEAKQVPIEVLMSGTEDSQRIETSGIVRAAKITDTKSNLDLDIVSAGYRFHAFPKLPEGLDPQSLIGATVRLKGTAAASYYPMLKRFIALNLFVPQMSDFVVESRESVDPFAEALVPLYSIARYQREKRPGQRVHVLGRVTYLRPGEDLFLQDKSGGLHVRTRQVGGIAVGDVVEAVGFADYDNFLPLLQDAILRKSAATLPVLAPKTVTMREVLDGVDHAGLVDLKGKLLDRFVRQDASPATLDGPSRVRTVLTMQSEGFTFAAETEGSSASKELAAIPIGSTIEVTGVCFTESGEGGKTKSFQILLPTAADVKVLAQPSWLTPQRLLAGLSVLLVVSIAAVSWTFIISKKNAALRVLVCEKEKARVELRDAHDQLEERVKERTAQLKLQITARKELELQSKATLAERTRLAQELHDTLEQALTGVALQLDTAAKLFEKEPTNAHHHLELARTLVGESQTEVHRSVWNLRCRALEQFDLPDAVMMSSKQITGGLSLQVEMKAQGRVRPLPEIVEENLLRIAQEALTNVIKHSGATLTEIDLDYGAQNIVLQVKDNGKGFEVDDCAGPREGHFGLLGISERARRLHGEIFLTSAPDAGTTVRVQIPLGS